VHQLDRGMAGGVAFVAAVPGLAPWGFYAPSPRARALGLLCRQSPGKPGPIDVT
jgi:hypothetical protein